MHGDNFWKINASKINSVEDFWQRIEKGNTSDFVFLPENLSGPKTISFSKFKRVSFSKTIIEKINFKECSFENCQFIGADFIKCEFHDCSFINCNTFKISIKESYIDPKFFESCLDEKKHQNIGAHLYHQLTRNSRDEDQPDFERYAYFKFRKWVFYQKLYERRKVINDKDGETPVGPLEVEILRFWIWEKLFGYGVRLGVLLRTGLIVLSFCTCINWFFSDWFGLQENCEGIGLVSAIYFSVVSLTTLGYGDIIPSTDAGRIWASVQSLIGFFFFATLASMIFRRISP